MSVKVYTRTTCAPCRTLKTYLQKKGITYDEVNVDEDPAAAREVMEQTGMMMVPMTLVDGKAVSGLNFSLLNQLLMV